MGIMEKMGVMAECKPRGRVLILMRPFIIKFNQRVVVIFCRRLLFYNMLIINKINMSLEFDTVGTSRLVC
jgi:hypothetical protein